MPKDVIIALDFKNAIETYAFLDLFYEEKPYVKIGMELFYSEGPRIVREIKRRGHKIFLDLKLHDIPNTVKKAMASLSKLGVDMCNLHAAGTKAMMEAAVEGLTGADGTRPILIAVTQLTSTDEERMRSELLIAGTMQDTVLHYAKNACEAGLDGVVCSPLEAKGVKEVCGERFLTVTPGIRFEGGEKGDQARIATPENASALGSDYIVVGRPITAAADPVAAYRRCLYGFLGKRAADQSKTQAQTAVERQKQAVAKALLDIGAVFLRPDEPFTWASGIKSPIYCDNRLTLSYPEVRDLIEGAIAETVSREYPGCEALIGTSTAGIAHAAIAAHILGLPTGYVRSAAKDHGRTNRIEGRVSPGQKVVVVEDLISTGGSVIEVVQALREAGAEVLGIVSIFTYGMKKALERLSGADVKNTSLSDFDTLVGVAVENAVILPGDAARLFAFRDAPADESWINKQGG